jgi:hypothetical protein
MARAKIEVTREWQQIATGRAIFSVLETSQGSEGALFFNESATDLTSNRIPNPKVASQYQQSDDLPTYVRATKDGYVLLADGAL